MDFSRIDLNEYQPLAREIILKASKKTFKRRGDFEKFRNSIIKEKKAKIFHNLYFVKAYNDLLLEGEIEDNPSLLNLIQKRGVRTQSGVAPVTVMTKPYPCPGNCIYCPTDVRMPKSYLPSQPAAQRAFRQRFNPYTQVFVRLKALSMTGHEISKVELRVIGGSFSAYPKSYQKWFIKRCLQALNEFNCQIKDKQTENMSNLIHHRKVKSVYGVDDVNTVSIKSIANGNLKFDDVVKENETSEIRCIGVNIETRPDLINKNEVKWLRELGVTKVEMGVQTLSDEIQRLTKRGHTTEDVVKATELLKDSAFKIGYHMMPNLPGSTPEIDKEMIAELFKNQNFQPDYLKIYPCVVMPKSRLALLYRKGEYKSYSDDVLEDVLKDSLKNVPFWCRVDRIARDIPANEIESGFKVSNIRQVLEKKLIEEGSACKEIRFREIKGENFSINDVELVIREYKASFGTEFFVSFEDTKNDTLLALLRLRFPHNAFIDELKNAALIREVHVYGRQVAVGKSGQNEKQHLGFGKKLIKEAEKLAKKSGFRAVAIIAGIGTREYYKKLGYKLIGTYMRKTLT